MAQEVIFSLGIAAWNCGTMAGIRFCGCGYRWASVRRFLCLFCHETHTKGLRAWFPTRPEEEEDWQGPRADQKEVSDIQGKVTVREIQQLKKKLGPVVWEAWSSNVRGWVRVPGSCVGISSGDTLAIATECRKSAKRLLPRCHAYG